MDYRKETPLQCCHPEKDEKLKTPWIFGTDIAGYILINPVLINPAIAGSRKKYCMQNNLRYYSCVIVLLPDSGGFIAF